MNKTNNEIAFLKGEKAMLLAKLKLLNNELAFQKQEQGKRADELILANKDKKSRAQELVIAGKELIFQKKEKGKRAHELLIANKDKKNRAEELVIADKELVFQKKEKRKREDELKIANKELEFEVSEKKKRADELTIANIELEYQNEEKRMRAAELAIANTELEFQNAEKKSRAAELVIANNELEFQLVEKKNRADELAAANKELQFQNSEKRQRASELLVAEKERHFQKREKGKRADELAIANEELIFQNAEKEKRAAELLEANKELESFSYSVSHDLRAPLRAIHGYTQILVEDYQHQLGDEAMNMLNEVIANSRKMGELIDNLLDFSRLGKQQISRVNVNVREMIDVVIAEIRPVYPNRIINIDIKNVENVTADRNMLKQVFINLISNAFKYTGKKEAASIEIGSSRAEGCVTYFVKDNGAGFDMRYYDKLFGVFQRLHSSNEFEGTGVGLAIIQKIITKHDGKVWGEGKVNEGASFYISLPAS